MPKFDFVVQNPPYSGSLHLDFLKKGYEMLSDKGQMIIIEPATWLIRIAKTGKNVQKYINIKKLLNNHINKIIIENFNKTFNVGLHVPFSITYIDKGKTFKKIESNIFGIDKTVNSIDDINLIGEYNLIWSILNKITCDKLCNHLTTKKINDDNIFYSKIITIAGRSICGDPRFSDVWYRNNLYASIAYWMAFDDRMKTQISNDPHKKLKNGYHYDNPVYTDTIEKNIYGTYNELNNFKYNVYNTKLFPFINLVLTSDQVNNSLKYLPWLVDKKYTDQEIYNMFNFTDEEIKLIETTIKKYERNSPWFNRYQCGPSEVTDEKVQKFIEGLNNA